MQLMTRRLLLRTFSKAILEQRTSSIKIRTLVKMSKDIDKSELKNRLTPLQWHVTQEKGTERPFTGCYNKFYEGGIYTCIVCEQELFSSNTKYDSGCGWPAFNDVLEQGRIKLTKDTSLERVRTEVTCSNCGAHLGHVFNDGPKPNKKRFCINSASINFHAAEVKKD
ncbi:PREDICTED: methionine-R-sulfoxide reductase B1 [Ceratosolen solmsi marchali]|uniref:Peptide-methionine (R)-S-oxide reductase n=1 Tax=Ceratosolen solmsi marchali TaxID=326594 RepID=A0AAJ6YJ19_9HYME|nr:PREDICTED: methionine-R-sulfoxide reductase B1 [Ceratosolen solmsi marchali]